MPLLPEGRSRRLSRTALALALLSGALAARGWYLLFQALEMGASPSFPLAMARSVVPVDMPPLAAAAAYHPLFFFAFFPAFWTSCAVLAWGVWRRLEWARRGAAAMLYLLAGTAALALLFPSLAVPKPIEVGGLEPFPEFNAAVRVAAFRLRLAAGLGGALCLWWGLLLDRGPLRGEFSPGPPAGEAAGPGSLPRPPGI